MEHRRSAALRRGRSGAVAARRLRSLLAADQSGFPPETLEMLKNDMCRVISRYLDVDAAQMEVRIRRQGRPAMTGGDESDCFPALCTVIPVKDFRLKGTF